MIFALICVNKIQSKIHDDELLTFMSLLLCIKAPLVIVGTLIVASRTTTTQQLDDCETVLPLQIPEQSFKNTPWPFTLICGMVPFCCLTQIKCLLNDLWTNERNVDSGRLSIDICLFVVICCAQSISISYYQLRAQDHRWWWRQFLVCGFSAIGLILFSILFYFGHLADEIDSRITMLVYFGYIFLAAFLLFMFAGISIFKQSINK